MRAEKRRTYLRKLPFHVCNNQLFNLPWVLIWNQTHGEFANAFGWYDSFGTFSRKGTLNAV
jgi:hypothetical protein